MSGKPGGKPRKFPGIRGKRPDKKYARGVRAKVKAFRPAFGLGPGHTDDSDVFPGH